MVKNLKWFSIRILKIFKKSDKDKIWRKTNDYFGMIFNGIILNLNSIQHPVGDHIYFGAKSIQRKRRESFTKWQSNSGANF